MPAFKLKINNSIRNHDIPHEIIIKILFQKCLKRKCFVPQLIYHDDEIEYVCNTQQINGCLVEYIKEKTDEIY